MYNRYYPKTDNTYSPHSSCRHELAPGVMAMPNLSRRSISGIRTPILSSVRKSWTELERNMDSDTEEWENRATNTSSTYQQRTSVFTRVVTSIWTVFTVIYAYTIGSVISLFTSAGSSRRQDGRKVPLLLYPIWWLVRCARRVTVWETQIGAWLSKGQRRNFLLGLLLLLLVAVPIYFLYAGDEKTSEQLDRTNFFHWLADGITEVLLVARSPLTWLLSASYDLAEMVKSTAILPVNWLLAFGSWLFSFGLWILSPIFWVFAALTSNETESADAALKAAYIVPPPIAAPQVSTRVSEKHKQQLNTEVDIDLLAKKVLESQAFLLLMSQLKGDHSSKSQDSQSAGLAKLSQELHELKTQINSMKLGDDAKHNSEHLALLALQGKTRNLERMVRLLQVRLGATATKACCENVNDQVIAIMGGMLGGTNDDTKTSAQLVAEMKAKLAALEQLEARLAEFSSNLEASQQSKMDELLAQILTITTDSKSAVQIEGTSDERVLAIVKEALAHYDADKTNIVDYALETSGGTILSTRCTENYDYKHGLTFYFGLNWFGKEYRPNNPRTIIQPSVHPGECWAFKGATGYVVIELAAKIRIMAVTMEHIPRSLAPNGHIDSAPKDFSIWGLVDLKDPEPLFLGKFRYEDNGQPLQTFEVEIEHAAYRNLELRIESNHGHVEYTCVYRFRVHGVPDLS